MAAKKQKKDSPAEFTRPSQPVSPSLAGNHELVDVARRGSAADYLVDAARHHLEIGGRSRRRDLDAAWQQKQPRLREQSGRACYLCVSEFETFTGRLAFRQ